MKVDKEKWVTKPMCSFFDLQMGKTPPRKSLELWENGTIPWVSIADMNGTKFISATKEMLSNSTIQQCNIPTVPIGTVLMSFKLTIGKTCIANVPLVTNEAIMAFYPKTDIQIDNSFLCYALSAHKWKGNRAVKGITINKKTISQEYFSLPPFNVQHSIARELDSVQAMIDGYRQQIADLDALAQSIFLDTFGDPVSNPKGWEKKQLSDLSKKISTGPFGSMLHKEDYDVDGIPAINPQDIENNSISCSNIALVNRNKAKELSKYILHENDIVIARRGDLSKCAVIAKSQDGWLCGTGSFFITLEDINPVLFFYFYKSISIQKYLNEKCIGATMPNLNQGILGSLNVPVPPKSLQRHFAAQIESIEKQKEQLRQQQADAETLMAERMQYYFA